MNKDTLSNIRYIYKYWKPEKIGLFDLYYTKSSFVIIPNCQSYQDIYTFSNRTKEVTVLQFIEINQVILPQLLRENALIPYQIFHYYKKDIKNSSLNYLVYVLYIII